MMLSADPNSEQRMKRLFPVFLLFAVACFAASSGEKIPTLVFESATKDFGKVTEGETLKHVFKFTNKGEATLEIRNAEPS